ncbi:unnamed protein product [Brassica rapa subsp. narinosa]
MDHARKTTFLVWAGTAMCVIGKTLNFFSLSAAAKGELMSTW